MNNDVVQKGNDFEVVKKGLCEGKDRNDKFCVPSDCIDCPKFYDCTTIKLSKSLKEV